MPAASVPSLRKASRTTPARVATVVAPLVVLFGLAAVLLNTSGWEYYKHVDEVLAAPAQWQNKRLQLFGFVTPGTLVKTFDTHKQQLRYTFQVENCQQRVTVDLLGMVPDNFKEGAEVVVKGKLDRNASLIKATEVITKCPSKYEENPQKQTQRTQRCVREPGRNS